MKLFGKKAATKKITFTAIDKAALKQVKGGTDGVVNITQGLTDSIIISQDIPT